MNYFTLPPLCTYHPELYKCKYSTFRKQAASQTGPPQKGHLLPILRQRAQGGGGGHLYSYRAVRGKPSQFAVVLYKRSRTYSVLYSTAKARFSNKICKIDPICANFSSFFKIRFFFNPIIKFQNFLATPHISC